MSKKIFLGTVKDENYYLTKHQWDCSWYWAFGYVGNHNMHTHFDSVFLNGNYNVPANSPFTQKQWWVILDFFKQAYALKAAAEVYQYAGHMSSDKAVVDVVCNKELAIKLNKDLEKVLDRCWMYMETALEQKEQENV